jgi:DNA-binding response OmpR family regulator
MPRAQARTIEEAVSRAIERAYPVDGCRHLRTIPAESWPTVFVVDDDPFLRALLGDWVEDAGFRAVRLGSGEACLAALSRERPAAVLLDLHMPGLSGAETLDFIRTADPALPVVAVTAESDPVAAVDLVDRGADDFLKKPVDRGRLVRALLAHARTARTPVAA